MRTVFIPVAFALGLALSACGGSERAATPAATSAATPAATPASGPDQIVLRFPRTSGHVRAYAFPRLDSAIWTSGNSSPGVARILGFDPDLGMVTAVDDKGAPVRVDLRLDDITRDRKVKLTHLTSDDGSTIYGITTNGSVTRLTPTGSWSFTPPAPARNLFPEPDGSLLILADRPGGTTIWQIHPPDSVITDTARLPRFANATTTVVGDRIYFTVDSGLIGLRSRGLEPVPAVHLDHQVRALTTTPSGDRLYIATDSTREVLVVDRYSHKIVARVPMPGTPSDLRMDPTGRFVLARAQRGDSAWVIAIGTDKVVGSVPTAWRADLPAVTPNGWIALLDGHDVKFVDGTTLKDQDTIAKGAADSWVFVAWNGFRPRSAALDQPVRFPGVNAAPADSAFVADTAAGSRAATAAPPAPSSRGAMSAPSDTQVVRAGTLVPRSDSAAAAVTGFTIQFAALRSATAAQAVAANIKLSGSAARVVATQRAGVTIYRVVAGPFTTRADAERVAKSSDRSFWIYAGEP